MLRTVKYLSLLVVQFIGALLGVGCTVHCILRRFHAAVRI